VGKVFTVMCSMGLMPGLDGHVPHTGRWGSVSEHNARQSAGHMVHGTLPTVYVLTYTSWEDGDDEDDDHRAKVRKKAWRCRCVLRDPEKTATATMITWIGQPVDTLWHQLQYLDEEGSALAVVLSDDSPFESCMLRITAGLRGCTGDGVSLAPVFWDLDSKVGRAWATRRVRFHSCSMVAQIVWRFIWKFEDWPYRIFEGCDPDKREDTVDKFWAARLCCLDATMMKTRHIFQGHADMLRCEAFWEHLWEVRREMRLTNMHRERLLARFKRNAPGPHPYMERVCAGGTLAQWLHHHIQAGGTHPMSSTRSALLKEQMPIRASRNLITDGRKSRAHVIYMNTRYRELRAEMDAPVSRADYFRRDSRGYLLHDQTPDMCRLIRMGGGVSGMWGNPRGVWSCI